MTADSWSIAHIKHLESLAAHTWPAVVQRPFGNWVQRASSGVTRRANSVLTVGSPPESEDWFASACRFYAKHNLPVRFHISPATPAYIDAFLEERGFSIDVVTAMMTGTTQEAIDRMAGSPADYTCMLHPQATPEWMDAFLELGHPHEARLVYEQIFNAIGPAKCFLEIRHEGETVGVGTAVAENGWAGFVNIATAESMRGRGIGSRIVRELAIWSRLQGAERLYLQVIADNVPAVALYRKGGYRPLYSYHYRSKDLTSLSF